MRGEPGTVNGRTRNETEMRGTGKERERKGEGRKMGHKLNANKL